MLLKAILWNVMALLSCQSMLKQLTAGERNKYLTTVTQLNPNTCWPSIATASDARDTENTQLGLPIMYVLHNTIILIFSSVLW